MKTFWYRKERFCTSLVGTHAVEDAKDVSYLLLGTHYFEGMKKKKKKKKKKRKKGV